MDYPCTISMAIGELRGNSLLIAHSFADLGADFPPWRRTVAFLQKKLMREQAGAAERLAGGTDRVTRTLGIPNLLAGRLGFEPRLTGPEPVVLPLHHRPVKRGV